MALSIDKEGGEGTYLDLPECFSGSKVKLLDFLREKLQGRLKGWFAKALSHGGKEILLKSIALALPVYAMSCFKLPKTVIDKLTSAMIEFWWSTGDNKKKIPWVVWKKLCKPKAEGGLGFHDIAQFNQSLLRKQAWRLWHNPSSLLAQIMKHIYFENCSFLDSKPGVRPSFAWRSILHGRDLLQKGLVNTIGDGSSIRLWVDNWIMDKIPRPPMYRQNIDVDLTLKVDHLIDPISKQWDIGRVRQLIAEEDIGYVISTKINHQAEDSWSWSFTNNGLYSTRSGYLCLDTVQELQSLSPSSLAPIEKALWSKLWKTNTTPKLKHFLWRALSGALAFKERLRSRCIPVDTTCTVCGSAQETICHLLFNCSFAQDVWRRSLIPLPPAGFSPSSVFLNLHYLVYQALKEREAQSISKAFPWILWHIWKSRNYVCFEQRRLTTEEVFKKALEDLVIWSDLRYKGSVQSLALSNASAPMKKWAKPPYGVTKCNIGSSWLDAYQNSGVSWLTRNHLGVTTFHSRRSYSHISSSLENDLMSFWWAIESLRNMRITRVIFQASSVAVREALLHPTAFPAHLTSISNILNLLYGFEEWSLEHVSDLGILPASAIALSVTKDHRYPSYISKSSPSWLQSLLLLESSTN